MMLVLIVTILNINLFEMLLELNYLVLIVTILNINTFICFCNKDFPEVLIVTILNINLKLLYHLLI